MNQHDLTTAIDTFLDCLAIVDPSKMLSKSKCHILTHIVNDVRRFGPSIGLSTETFESFNGVFRLCSVLSNRQAPSRDIGFNMADMARFKHIASGGTWLYEGRWTTAGKEVQNFFRTNEKVHQLMGWSPSKEPRIGDYSHISSVTYNILKFRYRAGREDGNEEPGPSNVGRV